MKKVLIGAGALLVLLIVAVTYVWTNLDSIVKDSIQTYGSQATKTAVRVDTVKLELTDGRAQIKGLTVANPPGFTDPNIFSLGEISTKIDIKTINQNPIIIDEILIKAPVVVYEINKAGVANADVLKENVGGSGSSKAESDSSASGGEELKMVIRRIVVEGSSAKVRIAALGKDQSVTLPKIVMTDVGKKSGGATAAEVATQLSDRILGNIKGSVAKIDVSKYLGKSADDIKARMQKGINGKSGGMPDVGGALKGVFSK